MDSQDQLHSSDDRHLVPDDPPENIGTRWDRMGPFHEEPSRFPLVNIQKTMEKTPCYEWENSLLISMVIFHMLVITRGYIYIHVPYRYTYHQWVLHKIPPAPRFDTSPEDHWAKSLEPSGLRAASCPLFAVYPWLVVTGTMEFLWLSIQLGMITPTDELIFFRRVEATNQ